MKFRIGATPFLIRLYCVINRTGKVSVIFVDDVVQFLEDRSNLRGNKNSRYSYLFNQRTPQMADALELPEKTTFPRLRYNLLCSERKTLKAWSCL